MKKLSAILIIGVLIIACSRKITSTSTTTTNTTPVTYTLNVKPIIDAKCSPCHMPSKGGKVANLDGYEQVKNNISEMLVRVQLDSTHAKFMPFKNKKPALTSIEIGTLKNWQLGGMIE